MKLIIRNVFIGAFALGSMVSVQADSAGTIIGEIQKFESEKDPKCYATASRLEDFMFGTPLSDAARFEKNALSRQLILKVWQSATQNKAASGVDVLQAIDIEPILDDFFKVSVNPAGHYKLAFSDIKSVLIHKDDLRQYSSIAYSLRAILAAQQTIIMEGDINTPSLSEEAVKLLKLRLDLLSLATLKLADFEARRMNEVEVSEKLVAALWEELISLKKVDQILEQNRDKTLIQQVIEQKLASYDKYNKVSSQIFLRNLQVFYARKSWPKDPQKASLFQHYFTEALIQFSAAVYLGSSEAAIKNGHAMIQEADVHQFTSVFLPQQVNQYEDSAFFTRLPLEQQVYIEAYDMDSFRDSGIHWLYLQHALKMPELDSALTVDPFAMELITENIAAYGVLLLRVAGDLAKKKVDASSLEPEDLVNAINSIQSLSKAHNQSDKVEMVGTIYSSPVSKTNDADASFVDVTDLQGVTFEHRSSDWLNRLLRSYLQVSEGVGSINIPPAFGGAGVAAEDIDGDGDTDLVLLSGIGNKLFLNKAGKFSEASGVLKSDPGVQPGEARQPLVADLDNDGDQDIVITYANQNHQIYENLGDAKFRLLEGSPIGGADMVGGPATVFDANNDGLLDVLVVNFGDYPNGKLPTLSRRNENGIADQLWINKGGLKFELAKNSGLENTGWGQAVTHTDLNGDGLQDVIIGNDFGVNGYYINKGEAKFSEVSALLGTNKPSYTMGIGLGDLNQDQIADVYISNIVTMNKDESYVLPSDQTPMKFNPKKLAEMRVVEANDLFISGQDKYSHSDLVGRGFHSTGWSWGADFFDFDNDADMDLYVTNGMNEFNIYSGNNSKFTDQYGERRDVYMPVSEKETNVLFVNDSGRFNNVTENSGLDFLGNSRAAAYLDWNDDGRLDVVLANYHGPARLYQNNIKNNYNWLAVKLVGSVKEGSNRDAIGARLVLTLENGQKLWREIHGSVAYMTVHPKVQYFGLAGFVKGTLEIRWPNGEIEVHKVDKVNTKIEIQQGDSV